MSPVHSTSTAQALTAKQEAAWAPGPHCHRSRHAQQLSPAGAAIGGGFSGSAAGASCAPAADWDCFRLLTNSWCCVFRAWICCWKAAWMGCTTAAYSVIREAWRGARGTGQRGAGRSSGATAPVALDRGESCTHLVLAKAQGRVLELLNRLFVKVAVFLPQLQQLESRRSVSEKTVRVGKCVQSERPRRFDPNSRGLWDGVYPGYLLLLLLFHSQEAGAVDGDHHFLDGC